MYGWRYVALRLVALLVASLLGGCDWIGGRTVFVQFRTAEGLDAGQSVYFAGVEVGTTQALAVVEGQARVPVRLSRRHRDALPAGAVFAISEDPKRPGSRCLLGYAVSAVPRRTENGDEIYQGVSGEIELTLLIGAEKAKEFWRDLDRAFPRQ